MKEKIGVMITRAQPFHIGHISVVQRMLSENDKILLIIGSSDKYGTKRNPFKCQIRFNVINSAIDYYKIDRKRIQIMVLPDFSSDRDIPYSSNIGSSNQNYENVNSEWGLYLYYNIVSKIKEQTFSIYYNDDKSIIQKWFPDYLWNRITLKQFERNDISSSLIREALLDNNLPFLKDTMPFLDVDTCYDLMHELNVICKKEEYMRKNLVIDMQRDFVTEPSDDVKYQQIASNGVNNKIFNNRNNTKETKRYE